MTTQTSGSRSAVATAAAIALIMLTASQAAAAEVSKVESKCASALSKGAVKVAKTILKETAKCREGDISGKTPGSCPNAGNDEKIDGAVAGVVASAEKSCKSVCSVSSTVECIADTLCPPRITFPELCSAGVKNLPFDMRRIGFPGPYCEATLGHSLMEPADIGQCVGEVASDPPNELISIIYGSLNDASNISEDALACLKALSKATQKLTATVAKGVAKCHDAINGGAPGDPLNCQTADAKLVDKIAKSEDKLIAALDDNCASSIGELDLCNAGVGQTDLAEAKVCLVAAAREIADSGQAPVFRTYTPVSIVDAAYPPRARCGDNVINQPPSAQLLLGEECDGSDDAACDGQCLPPGDVFECTCGNKKRVRLFNHASLTDSDAGWTGESHQQGVADLSGHITEMSNCDCDAMTGATCTGSSSDSVCDLFGYGLPTCSWDLNSGTRCDAHGNNNGTDADGPGNHDCYICDQFSANAGAFCVNESDCDAQCYDSGGSPMGLCTKQEDCAPGLVCRGQCDTTQSCFVVPNGAPLPVAAASAAVCAVQRLRNNITGTRNIVTGEHEINYKLFSIIHTDGPTTRPCPVCGGFCEGGSRAFELCEGRCSVTTDQACRFDVDCPVGETCTSDSPQCPGGFCQLQLVCGTSDVQVHNLPCAIEYDHPIYGSMSNDCLPNPANNITGEGFRIPHAPDTSGTVTIPFGRACTAPGFELLKCPCAACSLNPRVGCRNNADCALEAAGTCTSTAGEPTKPNECNPACNAVGPNFGVGCATGNSTGQGTLCATGINGGKLCDEDSDCPLSTCSDNPTHCTGDPAFEQFACNTNADCGIGTCGDACPGGRCVPLCVPTGDPLQGICAAGPEIGHCTGGAYVGKGCFQSAAEASCSATCIISNDPCVTQADCPGPGDTCAGPCPHATGCEAGQNGIIGDADDNIGGGACELFDRSCYLDPIVAQGGSTLGGGGDPTNDVNGVFWCFGATSAASVNGTSGFPGPGRVLSKGTNVTSGFSSIP